MEILKRKLEREAHPIYDKGWWEVGHFLYFPCGQGNQMGRKLIGHIWYLGDSLNQFSYFLIIVISFIFFIMMLLSSFCLESINMGCKQLFFIMQRNKWNYLLCSESFLSHLLSYVFCDSIIYWYSFLSISFLLLFHYLASTPSPLLLLHQAKSPSRRYKVITSEFCLWFSWCLTYRLLIISFFLFMRLWNFGIQIVVFD